MRQFLLDADIVAYKAAVVHETAIEWEDGLWTLHGFLPEAQQYITQYMEDCYDQLGEGEFKLFLTDSHNWRKDILPTYKSNRSGPRPILLSAIRQWMRDELGAELRPSLEADDLLGITATLAGNNCVVISEDKDLKTIPCTLYNPRTKELVEVSEFEADYYFMTQTLTGDTTDGYSGCVGVGPKKAEAILSGCKTLPEMWEAVVNAFIKAKLSEEIALQQAQVARICRASEFDIKLGKVIPWTPPIKS